MFKKKLVTFLSASLVVALLSTGFSMPRTAEAAEAAGAAQVADATMNLTQYVNPFAGSAIAAADFGTGGGAGMTFPGAAVPFGMMKWSPDTSWGDQLYGGYNYDATQIKGFSLTHLSGAGCRALQDVPIMPWVGPIGRSPGTNFDDYAANFSHTNESASPGSYSVRLDRNQAGPIQVDLTATTRTGIGNFTYPASNQAMMLVNPGQNSTSPYDFQTIKTNSQINIVNDHRLMGVVDSGGFCGGKVNTYKLYFAVEFDRPFVSSGTWKGATVTAGSTLAEGGQTGAYLTFDTASNPTVKVKTAISYVSIENALDNMTQENPNWDFDTVKQAASQAWNEKLNRIQVSVTEATKDDARTFYTTLYHTMQFPATYSDANGQYRGFDKQVHTVVPGHKEYATYSGWDIYRSQMQLQALINPEEASDMAQSLVDAAMQGGGGFPKWPVLNEDSNVMVGDPGAIIVANMYAFGARNFNLEDALTAMNKGASQPFVKSTRDYLTRAGLDRYLANGYIPVTGGYDFFGATSTAMEYNSADFAIAQFAQAVGDTEKYSQYMKHAQYWKNLFDMDTTYIRPKNADGTFISSFCPTCNNAFYDGFVEGNSAQYTWMIPFNIRSLADKMGGNAKAIERLDVHFTKLDDGPNSPYAFISNEPEHHVPWLYNFLGAPYKTQEVVRRVITEEFSYLPKGLFGNDDLGAMSALNVWGSLGMYPIVPGVGGVTLNGPLFEDIRISQGAGKQIHIIGKNASRANPYIQSLNLNGRPTSSTWLDYNTMANGATLEFTMGNKPNTEWGSPPSDAPPSFDWSGELGLNMALNKPATASDACSAAQDATKAVDGVGYKGSKWCSNSSKPWLQIDLGQSQNISGFIVEHAGEGGDDVAQNTRDYNIQVSNDQTTWTTVVNVTGNQSGYRLHQVVPLNARYVRLNIVTPTQNGGTQARIYELKVIGTGTLLSIPTPAAITGVSNGVAKTTGALGLPQTVTMVTDSGNANADVTWNVDTSSYDRALGTAQTFTITGTVALPAGVTNPNNVALTTSISVTVLGPPQIPGKIEAENYLNMSGIQTENSSEGTKDVGYTDPGDWMDYVVNVQKSGLYKVDYRVSVNSGTGIVNFLVDGVSNKITSLPSTGGWQNWNTVSDKVYLSAGKHTIRLAINTGGWNINWFELSEVPPTNLTSITAPAAIIGVDIGTSKTAAALGLPVNAVLVTESGNMNASVSWDLSGISYNPTTLTGQTFTVPGTVTLPSGVSNPNNVPLTTSVSVTVSKIPSSQITATSDSACGTNETANKAVDGILAGSKWCSKSSNIWLQLDLGSVQSVNAFIIKHASEGGESASWNTKAYNIQVSSDGTNWSKVVDVANNTKGITIDSIAAVSARYIKLNVITPTQNTDPAARIYEFQVLKAPSTDKTLQSVTTPAAITGVVSGTAKTAAALGLPATTELVTDKGSANANVAWNVDGSSYDPAVRTQQTFTVSGTVTLPAGVVNPNNVALTTSVSVTVLPAPMPQSTLTGLQQVNAGQVYDVTMGLSSVTQSVYQKMYALDLTLHYDPTSLQFDSVESLKNGFQVIDQREAVPGHIRIIAARASENQDVLTEGDSLKFKFTVKSVNQATNTTISVGNVVIANAQSNELQVGGSSREIQITLPSTPVDKLLLNATITNAQAKYDAAVEGNGDGLYAIGSKAQLQSAIDAANAAANASNATQQQVDSAKTALEAAIQVFTSKKITADINGGGVSVGDLALVAGVYGKQQGQSGWNEKADVNHDGKVDITDLAIVARAILQ